MKKIYVHRFKMSAQNIKWSPFEPPKKIKNFGSNQEIKSLKKIEKIYFRSDFRGKLITSKC